MFNLFKKRNEITKLYQSLPPGDRIRKLFEERIEPRGDEVCSFWLCFNVNADTYEDWHRKEYGMPPLNSCVNGFYHNHLKKWKTEFKLDKYNLSNQDNEKVFEEIKFNLEKLVLPLFNKFSDYEDSA